MREKSSLNLEKRYWLIVLKGKSYTCTNTKKHPRLFSNSMINGLGFFLSFYCCISSTSLVLFVFFFFVPLPFFPFLFLLYTMVSVSYSLSTCESGVGSFSVSSRTSLNLLLLTVRLLVYCSGITSTLMRSESQLGSI